MVVGRIQCRWTCYRGVTLSLIEAKVLEFLCLERLEVVYFEANLPHVNQTAYLRSVSCADTIFTTHEVTASYLNSGSKIYMCLYDLKKAFDSLIRVCCFDGQAVSIGGERQNVASPQELV